MPGLGTVINVALLIAGELLGLIGGRFITPASKHAHEGVGAVRFVYRTGRRHAKDARH